MTTGGILGLGAFLPAEIRGNDWWTEAQLRAWPRPAGPPQLPADASPAARRVFTAMSTYARDPFQGIRERRIADPTLSPTELEAIAAERALAQAGVSRDEIDLLLVHTAVPDYLFSNTGAILHERLGLPRVCLTLQIDASAYSFLGQLATANQWIASGVARHALLVQSSVASRLVEPTNPASVFFGDAATAIVVGQVDAPQILAATHRTDGRFPKTAIASVPGGRWYDGKPIAHVADPAGAFRVFLDTVDCALDVVPDALAKAGLTARDVTFFGVHQGTPWLRAMTQEALGLEAARTVDLFATTGYVFASSIPLVLETAHASGSLVAGDVVVLFGGGTGATYGATVLRWPELRR
ncbi:MAG TPA: 3-oxoacyl-[acyl-carrier-protein] synthase III C-terminal domain-containing protein [Kofleriaceae bacterium]|nr:3-oxoacyl-[acyl-carrier-protein] synthase III C-terminal domain-containing protein [Kofleriaceae bacterium]